MKRTSRWLAVLVCIMVLVAGSYDGRPVQGQSESRTFSETGHTVRGKFLAYWQQHGGLEQFGYPISPEMQEVSFLDGNTYTVQYFERAEFELHPENQPPYDVLLAQLGTLLLRGRRVGGQNCSSSGVVFAETGCAVSGKFLEYWQTHGGLAAFG